MIKQVIFDFGGVLLEWRPEHILERLYRDERDRSTIRVAVFQHPDWLEMDRGILTAPDAISRFCGRTGRQRAEFEVLLEEVRTSLKPIPESVALLRELADRKIPLFGLSNMPAATFDYLSARDEFWKLFNGIVISGRVKLIKPEARIFEYICREYGLVAAETAFIDDHLPNVTGAATLGFPAIQFRSAYQCRAELIQLLDSRTQSS